MASSTLPLVVAARSWSLLLGSEVTADWMSPADPAGVVPPSTVTRVPGIGAAVVNFVDVVAVWPPASVTVSVIVYVPGLL